VTNGGTGVVTSTGSGSVVLSTSPTLVTPLLGTPTSGNLANCTFPTLNQNTTGNAATATLATNATTATNLSGGTVSATTISGTTITASSQFSGPGTGLIGTAASLTVGAASTASVSTTQAPGTNNTTIATTAFVQAAATALGLGTMATQNANNVAITGGTINGVSGTNASLTVGNATNATTAATVSTTVASGAVGTTQTAGTNNTTIATTAFVAAAVAVLYPIGSIYTSTVGTNPNTLFGFGTWVAFADARVMIGAGVAYPAGSTGGSADAVLVSHNHGGLTGTQSADHTHNFSGNTGVENQGHIHQGATTGGSGVVGPYGGPAPDLEEGAGQPNVSYENMGIPNTTHIHAFSGTTSGTSANHQHGITTEGLSATNANMQPFISVYMWNRTA
jgi:hypothetical protein